ncbi:3-isopropylmalate dehydratase large subunit [Howardella ureilytica]|nr:3-isopropylmalate dehydratase large subunit [Lachnospiraceae bacterium]MDY2956029.1 3-isopropylmalate dehydratase large subunit [Lachnospiraceae bacterium]
MGMTMTQKILAKHAGLSSVKAGDLIEADLDLVLGNDITSPVAIKELAKFENKEVFNKDKIALVPDHFVPNKDIKSAEHCKMVREFAKENNITNYFEVGQMGIEHALLPEKGLVVSGDVVIGADSHTCTYGALGAFSTGIGSTDMAAGMATGKAWFKVPEAIKFNLTGELPKWVSGKDVILHIIGMIGVDGALYKSMEFTGPGVATLSIDDRFTIANMAIEAGGKNGIFPVDDVTRAYIAEHSDREPVEYTADDDAEYSAVYDINLSELTPTVSFPHLPENTHTFDSIGDIPINQVVIGSCTNGHIQDMREAAEVMKGRKIADGVRAIIIPATQQIYLQAMEEGLIKTFIEFGAVVSTSTCGPCLGGYMGILAAGERCVSTTNRNFVGRMGHVESEVYLASPAVAAASAVTGKLSQPAELGL